MTDVVINGRCDDALEKKKIMSKGVAIPNYTYLGGRYVGLKETAYYRRLTFSNFSASLPFEHSILIYQYIKINYQLCESKLINNNNL